MRATMHGKNSSFQSCGQIPLRRFLACWHHSLSFQWQRPGFMWYLNIFEIQTPEKEYPDYPFGLRLQHVRKASTRTKTLTWRTSFLLALKKVSLVWNFILEYWQKQNVFFQVPANLVLASAGTMYLGLTYIGSSGVLNLRQSQQHVLFD